LNGTQIVSEAWGNYLLIYLYDESGAPIGLQYRTKSYAANVFDTFYFEKNLQGDIVAIYNASGEKIGSYTYDAWGNCTVTVVSESTTLEKNIVRSYNPFRYRGYYYDTETGLYYLQSRYYNPAWGRFLNVDGLIFTGNGLLGFNMYVYCDNNPITKIDPTGYDAMIVVDYNFSTGIPIVGHTFLFIQDSDGKWYRSEVAGSVKKTIKNYLEGDFTPVSYCLFYEVTQEEVDSYRNKKGFWNALGVITGLGGYETEYLSGDYSACIEPAYNKKTDNYNYNLITNNCGTHVKDILKNGPHKSIEAACYNYLSFTPIPRNYLLRYRISQYADSLSPKAPMPIIPQIH
jgi:RHS repeat-associated protein